MVAEELELTNQPFSAPQWQTHKKKFRVMKEINKMALREEGYNGRLMRKFYNVQNRANWFEREVSSLNVKIIKQKSPHDLLSIEQR